ncbi:hypothetical protein EVAR_70228_1 [Eumeta japonica]|uniref:Uncharacterized protein n=1 Tax=Eumeta variegata TaxID=151549 RepID=A0A4C1SZK2_EUMVA|nr:hypothetical protein EVAR_70228_1 [Eumeta japonica]
MKCTEGRVGSRAPHVREPKIAESTRCLTNRPLAGTGAIIDTVAALHHSWTSATSGLRGLFLITCRQTFFVCEAPSGARPSAVADVADA